MSALAHWQAQYAQRSGGAEPAWLRDLREAAWSGFRHVACPAGATRTGSTRAWRHWNASRPRRRWR